MKRHLKFRFGVILSIIWCLISAGTAFSTQETLDEIKADIKTYGLQWKPKESWVTRLSREEFRKLLGAKPSEAMILEYTPPPFVTEELPTYVDWKDRFGHRWVTSVKNQGTCGSCAAFAVVAALESRICIECDRPDEDIDLSEMDVFNCGGGDCISGWSHYDATMQLACWNGAPDDACWPYEPFNMPCSSSCSNRQLRKTCFGYYSYIWGEYDCKQCVALSPLIARMAVYSDFEWYSSGIYEPAPNATFEGYHAVCIVGYKDDGYDRYWIVKNSWSDEWGEDGFFRIKMGKCDIETGAGEYNFFIWGVVYPPAPTAPSNLNATAVSKTQVNLSWQDNSNNEIGFEIHRKKAGGNFSLIDTVGEDETSYGDVTVEEGTKYYYEVKAYNIGEEKPASNIAIVITPLMAPSNLDVTVITSTTIHVTWQDNSSTENGFEIWEKKGSGSWQQKTTVGANVTAKDITGLEEGTQYCYKVRAYNSYIESNWSNTDCATTPWTQPAAPSNLNASPSEGLIELWWQDNSNNETGFQVWRKKEGEANFSYLKSVGKNVTSCQDTAVEAEFTYYYKVRAYNPEYYSSFSNIASATTPPVPPAAPSNLLAYGYCWEVKLTWQDNSNNEDGFKIYRRSGTEYYYLATVGPNITTYWNIELYCGQHWCYKVRAFRNGSNSPFSNAACDWTDPCYQCGYPLSLKITPDKDTVNPDELVTYTYILENKGKIELTDIELIDEEFGIIATKFTLNKGKIKTFTRTVILTETTTNCAVATALYQYENKIESAKTYACATVEIRK